ncbi:hypothetical protein CH281_23440 [Rhodococcus sp. 06-221-2]|uniref:glycosyltransferase n=1 Tax=Rhodococcus sp. 06-221-2 TaxID=2022514 RepID=UPI000B9A5B1E|nr:glycosyltransferase [Rhodococcus sp. 06-221-2]OZC96814.1 hypothetical protein CH281_23440 [Rhodococcus sp. 06-221-2]
MRILHIVPLVSDDAAFGGPVRGTVRQSLALQNMGHQSEILALWRGLESKPETVMDVPAALFKFRRLPGHRFATAVSPSAIRWLVANRSRYDIVHAHAGRDLWILVAMIVLRLTRKPYVLQTHGMLAPRRGVFYKIYDALLTRPALSGAKAVMYLTSYEQRDLEAVHVPINTVHLVNGVDDIGASIPKHAVDNQSLRVVFISRVHPRKRVVDLVNAVAAVRSKGHNVTLDIYGPDEGSLGDVIKQIRALKIEDSVRYMGALEYSAVRRTLTSYDVMALPSVEEPFPNIVLESLASGVPTLITSSCGLAPYLKEAEAGWVVEPGAESLAGGLCSLHDDPYMRIEMARRGQLLASELFTMSGVASKLITTYDRSVK